MLNAFKDEPIVATNTAINTQMTRPFNPVGNKFVTIVMYASLSSERSGNKALKKFYTDGDFSTMEKEVDKGYSELKEKSEYVSQLWMGIDYARAGSRDKALDCFNNAIALKETAITFLLLRHFDFLNIKYLSMALITRKIRQTINF